jgi:hypothetical protein
MLHPKTILPDTLSLLRSLVKENKGFLPGWWHFAGTSDRTPHKQRFSLKELLCHFQKIFTTDLTVGLRRLLSGELQFYAMLASVHNILNLIENFSISKLQKCLASAKSELLGTKKREYSTELFEFSD